MSSTNQPQSLPPVIDLEALLAPIAGENPAGENLQYVGIHDELREARRSEDALDQGDWAREIKEADWEKVVELATGALANRSKDLQVGAWLGEALVKEHGFAGLRDGLHLMRGLHENFWDQVYPEIDEGDMEARANSLSWLDRQLSEAIREIPLTRGPGGEALNFIAYGDAQRLTIPSNIENLSTEDIAKFEAMRATARAEGKTTSDDWRSAKAGTPRAFYEELYLSLNEGWEEYGALDRVMDEKFGRQTPGLGALKKMLDEIRNLIERTVKEKRELEPDPVEMMEGDAQAEGAEGGAGIAFPATGGPIRTRQDALNRLSEVAEFFRRTEPHSPVSYLVQRAVHWGQMPLEAWLENVIKDPGVLASLRETLGIDRATESFQ